MCTIRASATIRSRLPNVSPPNGWVPSASVRKAKLMLNNYDVLAADYQRSAVKPDKLYSTLPTVLSMLGDMRGKTIVDLGCGAGFFTNEFAHRGAERVVGIDLSREQIALAIKSAAEHAVYEVGDIFTAVLPKADAVVAPYVLNYAETVEQLQALVQSVFEALSSGGVFVAVVDIPEGKDLKRFGAIKTIDGAAVDGAPIKIELYNGEDHICTLHAVYFSQVTIERILSEVGFAGITWHKPLVSDAGIEAMGMDFWNRYADAPELAYVSATKP